MANLQYGAEHKRQAGVLKLPEPAAGKAAWLDAKSAETEAESDARSQTYASLVKRLQDAKGDRAHYIARTQGQGQQPAQVHLDELDAEIKRAEGALQGHQSASAAARAISNTVEEINAKVRRFALGLNGSTRIHAAKPKSDVGSSLERLGGLKAERQRVDEAPVPLEMAVQQISTEVDRLAAEGRPRARVSLEHSGPHLRARLRHEINIEWPREVVRAETANGELPLIANATAMIAWAMRDEIKKVLMADLRSQYEGVEVALTPADRQKRIAEIDAQIAIAEHDVAALTWTLINQGDDSAVRFLDGLDPRAILGVVA